MLWATTAGIHAFTESWSQSQSEYPTLWAESSSSFSLITSSKALVHFEFHVSELAICYDALQRDTGRIDIGVQ